MSTTFPKIKTYADGPPPYTAAEVNAEVDNFHDNLSLLGITTVNNETEFLSTLNPKPSGFLAPSNDGEYIDSIKFQFKAFSGEDEWADLPVATHRELFAAKVRDVSVSTTYLALITDAIIRGDASGGAFVLSLLTAVGKAGKQYMLTKADTSANVITINPDSTETIQGARKRYLRNKGDYLVIASDGANWIILAQSKLKGTPEFKKMRLETPGATNFRIVTITADWLDVVNSDGDTIRIENIARTLDIEDTATATTDGLDTGSKAADRTYPLWIMYDPLNDIHLAILSLSNTFAGVTKPSADFTYGVKVSFARTDAVSNIFDFVQNDTHMMFANAEVKTEVLTADTSTSRTPVDISSELGSGIDTVVEAYVGWFLEHDNTNATQAFSHLYPTLTNPDSIAGIRLGRVRKDIAGALHSFYASGEVRVPIFSDFTTAFSQSTETNGMLTLFINGFELDIRYD